MAFYTSWTEWCVVGFKEHNANDILENKWSISAWLEIIVWYIQGVGNRFQDWRKIFV